MMQDSGFSITSSLSFNIVLCLGQIAGTLLGGYLAGIVGHRKGSCFVISNGCRDIHCIEHDNECCPCILFNFLGGASTVGAMNLGNPYITEFYPREIRATGTGYAQAIGRIGSILAPTLIAMLLVTGMDPKLAFATFAVPSILAAIGFINSRKIWIF